MCAYFAGTWPVQKKLFSVMTCSGHRHHGPYNSYVYAFRQHISHSKLAYPVMACDQNKCKDRFSSYVFVFAPHMPRSKITLSFIRCGRFLVRVTKAQPCGAIESVTPCTMMAACYYRVQVPHFVFAMPLPSYSIRNEEVSGFFEQDRKIVDLDSV